MKDLLIQLMEVWISKDEVPIEMSQEFIENPQKEEVPIIQFRYKDNTTLQFGFTQKRYDKVIYLFNTYWSSRSNPS